MIDELEKERDTRAQILAVSEKLFSERGFANVSIRDICDQAGVTAPTIYHYFNNKDQLFNQVIQQSLSLKDFRDRLFAAVNNHAAPADRLFEFIRVSLAEFPRNFFNPGMFLQSTTQINRASIVLVTAELSAVEDLLLTLIQEGIDQGVFRRVNPRMTRRLLINILLAYLVTDVNFQPNEHVEETASFIFQTLMNGLQTSIFSPGSVLLEKN